jgi:predicted ester cyclase
LTREAGTVTGIGFAAVRSVVVDADIVTFRSFFAISKRGTVQTIGVAGRTGCRVKIISCLA